MKTIKNRFKIAFLAALALILLPGIAAAQQMKTLNGHVPRAVSRFNLQSIGTLDPNINLNLSISLPLQNQSNLNSLLSQIYDSKNTNYHHYLKPGEFSARFGPSEGDYQKVVNFAATHGLTVVGQHANRTLLDVSGKVSDIQNAFKITLRTYHHPTEHRDSEEGQRGFHDCRRQPDLG